MNDLVTSRILTAADFSVKPCDNFYEFACGKWMEKNIVPEDKSYHATFTILRDEVQIIIKGLLENNGTEDDIESVSKARNLYQSCMNTGRNSKEPVLHEFKWIKLGYSFRVEITTPKEKMTCLEGYLRETFSMKGVEIELNDEDTVIIHDMNYTSKFNDFLDSYSPRTVANYVILRFLRNRWNNLPKRFTDLVLELSKLTDGRTVSKPRWQKCSSLVTSYIGLAVGRLFVKDNFAPDAKVEMSTMIKYIKESFNDILNELDWMDEDTMAVAEEKIEYMEEKIGYDEDILDDDLLDRRHENVSIDPNFYFDNILGLLNTAVKENLIKLRSKVYRLGWETAPSTVNAYYSSTNNRIIFPAGILQQPYYHKDQLWSLNFGAIGTLIGHEITHGFDDGGRQFDKDGRLDQWWNDSAIERFNKKTDCFKNQYGNFRLPEAGGIKMNGINTLGENIADNGGIKQSFRGYQKWLKHNGGEEKLLPGVNLTNNQLFFIAFAQIRCTNMRKKDAIGSILTAVHSPARFRVIGTLQNYEEFARVYNCPVGSFMNPLKKCSVW
ncbi:membrane metallo-endopeptidase-like 1 [Mytilus californianus]|uniref:membrane metallo-endopeptidase-like 1 n=1 Tax=Mytilus californianus TaxID=6549 RepID=UPI00224730B2|nr:membrane metallo-endopeptidase-like 1 [Mytilus californianus]